MCVRVSVSVNNDDWWRGLTSCTPTVDGIKWTETFLKMLSDATLDAVSDFCWFSGSEPRVAMSYDLWLDTKSFTFQYLDEKKYSYRYVGQFIWVTNESWPLLYKYDWMELILQTRYEVNTKRHEFKALHRRWYQLIL